MKQSFNCAASYAFKLRLKDNFMHKINFVFPSGKSNLWNAVFISVFCYVGRFLDVAESVNKAAAIVAQFKPQGPDWGQLLF